MIPLKFRWLKKKPETKESENLTFQLDTERFTLPSGWHEVTVDQFLRLRKAGQSLSQVEMLSIFSGLPVETWMRVPLTEINFDLLNAALSWCHEPLELESLVCPKYISVGDVKLLTGSLNVAIKAGHMVRVPKDLRIETYGQKVMFDLMVLPELEKSGDVVDCIDSALAIYLQPAISGKPFDSDNLDPYIEAIRKCKIVEAYPVAAFFLRKLILSTKTSK